MMRLSISLLSLLLACSACSKEESTAPLTSAPVEPVSSTPTEAAPVTPAPAPAPEATPEAPPEESGNEEVGASTAEGAALELVRSIVKHKVEKARSILFPMEICSIAPENEQAKCREIVQLMHDRLAGFSKSAPSSFNPGSVVNLKHRGPPGVSRFLVQPVGNPGGRGPQVVVAKFKGRYFGSYPPDNRFPIQTLPTAETPTADDLKSDE